MAMKKTGIRIGHYRLSSSGKLEKLPSYRDAAHRIRARKSKKVRVVKSRGGP